MPHCVYVCVHTCMYARMYVYNLMFLYGLLHYVTLHDIALRVLIASYVSTTKCCAVSYYITFSYVISYCIAFIDII